MDGESYVQQRQRKLDGRSPAAAAGPSIVDKVCAQPCTPDMIRMYVFPVSHEIFERAHADQGSQAATCSRGAEPTATTCKSNSAPAPSGHHTSGHTLHKAYH